MEHKRRRVHSESSASNDGTLNIQVSLTSGRCETISVLKCGTVADLKMSVQRSFGQGFLRLVTLDAHFLDPTESIELSRLQDGDSITAIAQQPKIAATQSAFALWCEGAGRIVTWGHASSGGDSSAVQDQLRNVQHVYAASYAFAAIVADGSVVTWGRPEFGGDSSEVQDQLRTVRQIAATGGAFAAILADGSVVTWGDPDNGGDSSEVQDQLKNVKQISATISMILVPLPQYWQMQMEVWWHGAILTMTAQQSKMSSGMCSKLLPLVAPLLLFWQMAVS